MTMRSRVLESYAQHAFVRRAMDAQFSCSKCMSGFSLILVLSGYMQTSPQNCREVGHEGVERLYCMYHNIVVHPNPYIESSTAILTCTEIDKSVVPTGSMLIGMPTGPSKGMMQRGASSWC